MTNRARCQPNFSCRLFGNSFTRLRDPVTSTGARQQGGKLLNPVSFKFHPSCAFCWHISLQKPSLTNTLSHARSHTHAAEAGTQIMRIPVTCRAFSQNNNALRSVVCCQMSNELSTEFKFRHLPKNANFSFPKWSYVWTHPIQWMWGTTSTTGKDSHTRDMLSLPVATVRLNPSPLLNECVVFTPNTVYRNLSLAT